MKYLKESNYSINERFELSDDQRDDLNKGIKLCETDEYEMYFNAIDFYVIFKNKKNPLYDSGDYTNQFTGEIIDVLLENCQVFNAMFFTSNSTYYLGRAESGMQSEDKAYFEIFEIFSYLNDSYSIEEELKKLNPSISFHMPQFEKVTKFDVIEAFQRLYFKDKNIFN